MESSESKFGNTGAVQWSQGRLFGAVAESPAPMSSSASIHEDRYSVRVAPAAGNNTLPDEAWVQAACSSFAGVHAGAVPTALELASMWMMFRHSGSHSAFNKVSNGALDSSTMSGAKHVRHVQQDRKPVRIGRYPPSERRTMLRRWMEKRKHRVWGKDQVRYKYRQVVALARAREGKGRFGNSTLGRAALIEAAHGDAEMIQKAIATMKKKRRVSVTSSESMDNMTAESDRKSTKLNEPNASLDKDSRNATFGGSPMVAEERPNASTNQKNLHHRRAKPSRMRKSRKVHAISDSDDDDSSSPEESSYVTQPTTTRSGRRVRSRYRV